MCGLFVYARVRKARKKTGLGNFEFFGIFGKFWFFGFQKGCRSLHILFEM